MGAVGYGVSAAIAIAGANQARKAYEIEAQQKLEQADIAGIEADQQAINRTAQLNEQLSSILATTAGSGVSVLSPTTQTITRAEKKIASADLSSIKFMGDSKRRQFKISASGSRVKGKAAQLQGYGQAVAMGTKAYMST